MIDRHAAGHRKALGFGAAHDLERLPAGNLRGVIARAGQFDEPEIALEHDDFRGRGNAGKPSRVAVSLAFITPPASVGSSACWTTSMSKSLA